MSAHPGIRLPGSDTAALAQARASARALASSSGPAVPAVPAASVAPAAQYKYYYSVLLAGLIVIGLLLGRPRAVAP